MNRFSYLILILFIGNTSFASQSAHTPTVEEMRKFFVGIRALNDGLQARIDNWDDPNSHLSEGAILVKQILAPCAMASNQPRNGEEYVATVDGRDCQVNHTLTKRVAMSADETQYNMDSKFSTLIFGEDIMAISGVREVDITNSSVLLLKKEDQNKYLVTGATQSTKEIYTIGNGVSANIVTASVGDWVNDTSSFEMILSLSGKDYFAKAMSKGDTQYCSLQDEAIECNELGYALGY